MEGEGGVYIYINPGGLNDQCSVGLATCQHTCEIFFVEAGKASGFAGPGARPEYLDSPGPRPYSISHGRPCEAIGPSLYREPVSPTVPPHGLSSLLFGNLHKA